MFRLIKIENGSTEILDASGSKDYIDIAFKDYVFNNASNGDEYTCVDFENLVEQGYENIGSYKIEIDDVSKMTEKEFVACDGLVCIHCHSEEVDPSMTEMNEGYVSRTLTCDICGNETVEQFTLTGFED